MAATRLQEVIISSTFSAKLVKWRVCPGTDVREGSVLGFYEKVGQPVEEGNFIKQPKLKCRFNGKVKELLVKEGDIVTTKKVVAVIEEAAVCEHKTVMKDLCCDCGADLRRIQSDTTEPSSPTSASVSLLHNIPELRVTVDVAEALGKEDEERLFKARKLALVVDLDQTLIHTTTQLVPNDMKDVHHFQLPGHPMWYHTKFRPGAFKFLHTISALYELHIFTMGSRLYAHTIAAMLDPKQELFAARIRSRDECLSAFSKFSDLRSLFPCGDSMVCIIDDREDIWNSAPNLIRVKPYQFFKGVGDINAPPTTGDTNQFPPEHPPEEQVHPESSPDKQVHPGPSPEEQVHPESSPDKQVHPGPSPEEQVHPESSPDKQVHPGPSPEEQVHPESSPDKQVHPGPSPEEQVHPESSPDKQVHPGPSPEEQVHPESSPDKQVHPGPSPEEQVHPESSPDKQVHPGPSPEEQVHPGPPEEQVHPGPSPVEPVHPESSPEDQLHLESSLKEQVHPEPSPANPVHTEPSPEEKVRTDPSLEELVSQQEKEAEGVVESGGVSEDKNGDRGSSEEDSGKSLDLDHQGKEIGHCQQVSIEREGELVEPVDSGDERIEGGHLPDEQDRCEGNSTTVLNGDDLGKQIQKETDVQLEKSMPGEFPPCIKCVKDAKVALSENTVMGEDVSMADTDFGTQECEGQKDKKAALESAEYLDKQCENTVNEEDLSMTDEDSIQESGGQKAELNAIESVECLDRQRPMDAVIEGDRKHKGITGESNVGVPNVETEFDDDDYLLHLEDILKRIHRTFYSTVDKFRIKGKTSLQDPDIEMYCSPQTLKPDTKLVVTQLRHAVLHGANIVFTGVIPTNVQPEQSHPWQLACALGANVSNKLTRPCDTSSSEPATTHVIAGRLGTEKAYHAIKVPQIQLVNPNWLWCCAERWEWVDEELFPVDGIEKYLRTSFPKGTPQSTPRGTPKNLKERTLNDNSEQTYVMSSAGGTRTSSSSADLLMSSINPLLSFSSEEVEDMDKEVEELMNSSCESDVIGSISGSSSASNQNSSSSSSASSITGSEAELEETEKNKKNKEKRTVNDSFFPSKKRKRKDSSSEDEGSETDDYTRKSTPSDDDDEEDDNDYDDDNMAAMLEEELSHY